MATLDKDDDGQRRLAGIVDSAMDAIISIDEAHRIILFNPAAEQMFGVPTAEALGQPLARFIPRRFRANHDEHIRRFRDAGVTTRSMGALGAISGVRTNGEEFPLEASISHVEIGGEHLATVILRDITERKLNEDARILLAREVDHRAKNALAVAQSLVRMTKAPSKEEYAAAVEGRIASLARAHALLSRSRWQGGDLAQLIDDEIAGYSRPGHAEVSGPLATLVPDAVQPVSLVFHELATNAVKYGALKAETGRVDVSWALQADGRLEIRWNETGGPAIVPPTHAGFGTRLLTDVITKQLHGEITRDWRPGGLVVEIRLGAGMFRLERAAGTGQRHPESPAFGDASPGAGRKILVVEDETLLAMELAAELEQAGWKVVGPAYSLAEGLELAEAEPALEAALLDVNLSGRAVYPLASALKSRGVPFVFCTGYETVDPDGRFLNAPLIRKPVNFQLMRDELSRLMAA